MANITAVAQPTLGHVVVLVDWPGQDCVLVERVIDATGARAPLRPYVWPCMTPAEAMHLSGGQATFWDTEAPLDTPFHYEASVTQEAAESYVDEFLRTTANHWGGDWSILNGAAAVYSTIPGRARITNPAVTTDYLIVVGDPLWEDYTVSAFITPSHLATGAAYEVSLAARVTSLASMYLLTIQFTTAGTVSLDIWRNGVQIAGPVLPGLNYTAGVPIRAAFEVDGTVVHGTVWAVGTNKPDSPQIIVDDPTGPTSGRAGAYLWRNGGNTNAALDARYASFTVSEITDPVQVMAPVVSETLTLDSLDGGWLRDPLRPCLDRRVWTCWPEGPNPACVPGESVFFVGMESERYQAITTSVLPNNARRPIPQVRQRRDRDSTLALASRTFTDRDALIELTRPGSPLLFSTLSEFGVPDTYMDIGEYQIDPGVRDLRFQPRLHRLPFSTVDRPVGPAQGVCGERFMDYCTDSWDDLAAAGTTYADLLLAGVDLGETYAEVAATYATYALAEVGNTYTDLLAGT